MIYYKEQDDYETLHFYAQFISRNPSSFRDYLLDETGHLKEFVKRPTNIAALARILEVVDAKSAKAIADQIDKAFLYQFIGDEQQFLVFMQRFPRAAMALGVTAKFCETIKDVKHLIHFIHIYPKLTIGLLTEKKMRQLLEDSEEILEIISVCPDAIQIFLRDKRIGGLHVDAKTIEEVFPVLCDDLRLLVARFDWSFPWEEETYNMVTKYSYDAAGQLLKKEDKNFVTYYYYNPFGEVVREIKAPKIPLAQCLLLLVDKNLRPRKPALPILPDCDSELLNKLQQFPEQFQNLRPYFYLLTSMQSKVSLAMWFCQETQKEDVLFQSGSSLLKYFEKICHLYLLPFQTLTMDMMKDLIHAFEAYHCPLANLWCSYLLSYVADGQHLDKNFPREMLEIMLLDAMRYAESVFTSQDRSDCEIATAKELLWHITFMHGEEFTSLKEYDERIQMRCGENLALFSQSEGYSLGFFSKPILESYQRLPRELSDVNASATLFSQHNNTQQASSESQIEPIEEGEPTTQFAFYKFQ